MRPVVSGQGIPSLSTRPDAWPLEPLSGNDSPSNPMTFPGERL